MSGKSKWAAMAAVAYAKANPGKRALIVTGTEESAKRHRSWLVEQNGGARPFNVKVRSLSRSKGRL